MDPVGNSKPRHSPRTSPYAEECVRILLHGGQCWLVHRGVLRKSTVLAKLCRQAKDGTVELGQMLEDSAHILVHYLYTGVYQSLADHDALSTFRSSIAAYAASYAFALPGLQDMAKPRIERQGKDLPAHHRLAAAREAYPNPVDEDSWFLGYLESCVRTLPENLVSFDFLGPMPTFAKTILKIALKAAREETDGGPMRYVDNRRRAEESGPARIPSKISASDTYATLGDESDPNAEAFELVSVDAYEGPTQVESCEAETAPYDLLDDDAAQVQPDHILGGPNEYEAEHAGVETAGDCTEADPSPWDNTGFPGNTESAAPEGTTVAATDACCPLNSRIGGPTSSDPWSSTSSEAGFWGEVCALNKSAFPDLPPAPAPESWAFPVTPDSSSDDGSYTDPSPTEQIRREPRVQLPLSPTETKEPATSASLDTCLGTLCPSVPPGLQKAPFAIVWEVLRVLLHCSIDPALFSPTYDDTWQDQDRCWEVLGSDPLLDGCVLPEKSDPRAWQDCIHNDFKTGPTTVIFVAEVKVCNSTRPGIKLVLRRLKRQRSCRLYRRFGSDRFLRLLFPSAYSLKFPPMQQHEVERAVTQWLTSAPFSIAGRQWAVFWAKAEKKRRSGKSGSPQEQIFRNGIHFFAENGQGFVDATIPESQPPKTDTPMARVKCSRDSMLDWLLQFRRNASQPCLRLISRISLGLTMTTPTVVLEENQILQVPADITSLTTEKVMNDGIGLISQALMRKVREILGLPRTPCAIQGRIGSAKGMWITAAPNDQDRNGHMEEWIKVFPSQVKWACDWTDEDHRTLEVMGSASPLQPSNLNSQLLPILDDRSRDKQHLRYIIAQRVKEELGRDLEYLKSALQDPPLLRKWLHEMSGRNSLYARDVPFLGGLPDTDADLLSYLVDGGFDPLKQKYLADLVQKLQREKCKKLETDLKIKIAQSTNAYMVVDFHKVLEPDEVHICFSTPFGTEDISDLDGVDVLVARNPAHLPSDIQKVKAVFRPELRHLQDVIVFPSRGDTPLAQKLSGGDYDGDRAWICWDPEIVSNFENATVHLDDVPPSRDVLSSYLGRKTDTVGDLISTNPGEDGTAICLDELVRESLSFALKPSLLGPCNKFKEKFCYARNCISDRPAMCLSWLLGELVDEAKNGIIFTRAHWERFQEEMVGPLPRDGGPNRDHISDHLRSAVESAVGLTLRDLSGFMDGDGACPDDGVFLYDADIANYWNEFEKRCEWASALRRALTEDLEACAGEWRMLMPGNGEPADYRSGVCRVSRQWQNIKPRTSVRQGEPDKGLQDQDSVLARTLLEPGLLMVSEFSGWELLKASLTFTLYHRRLSKFVWRIAGRQLQFIKAFGARSGLPGVRRRCWACFPRPDSKVAQGRGASATACCAGCKALPVPVVSHVYDALRPDNKYIEKMRAMADRYDGEE